MLKCKKKSVKVSHTYSNVDLFQSLSIFDNLKNGKDRKKRIGRNERLFIFESLTDISIDFLSLPKTTYALNGFTVEVDQVCVIVCRLSKMVHIVPCHKTIDAEHTAQLLLNHVFRLHGYPRTIVSDRDPRFLSAFNMTVVHRAQADDQLKE
ncbi:hypothetical protein ACTFIY_000291 [Dictyostelium cf. discoideum]